MLSSFLTLLFGFLCWMFCTCREKAVLSSS